MSELNLAAPETAKTGKRGKSDTWLAAEEEEVIATAATTSSVTVESSKRRKVEAAESEPALSTIAVKNRSSLSTSPRKPLSRKEMKDLAADTRFGSGSVHAPSTACSEEESADGFKSVDPAAGCFKLKSDNSSHIDTNVVSSSSESEVCADLPVKEMESKSAANNQIQSVVYETPTAEEIEEFFSDAEKFVAQRFKEKYNFDIVNEVPVKGRFEWSRVKP